MFQRCLSAFADFTLIFQKFRHILLNASFPRAPASPPEIIGSRRVRSSGRVSSRSFPTNPAGKPGWAARDDPVVSRKRDRFPRALTPNVPSPTSRSRASDLAPRTTRVGRLPRRPRERPRPADHSHQRLNSWRDAPLRATYRADAFSAWKPAFSDYQRDSSWGDDVRARVAGPRARTDGSTKTPGSRGRRGNLSKVPFADGDPDGRAPTALRRGRTSAAPPLPRRRVGSARRPACRPRRAASRLARTSSVPPAEPGVKASGRGARAGRLPYISPRPIRGGDPRPSRRVALPPARPKSSLRERRPRAPRALRADVAARGIDGRQHARRRNRETETKSPAEGRAYAGYDFGSLPSCALRSLFPSIRRSCTFFRRPARDYLTRSFLLSFCCTRAWGTVSCGTGPKVPAHVHSDCRGRSLETVRALASRYQASIAG